MALIELKDVTKVYQMGEIEVHALRSVSLSIERGESVALIGPSGSGKSTLMNTLGCLDRPTSGSYLLNGQEVVTMSRDERAIRNREKSASSSRISTCSLALQHWRTSSCRCCMATLSPQENADSARLMPWR